MLLLKSKSTEVETVVQTSANNTNSNKEMEIKSWNNKIFNMQNVTQQSKPIAFYKPKLLISSIGYYKLGDVVSQNIDYSVPRPDQFTLLIRGGQIPCATPVQNIKL